MVFQHRLLAEKFCDMMFAHTPPFGEEVRDTRKRAERDRAGKGDGGYARNTAKDTDVSQNHSIESREPLRI